MYKKITLFISLFCLMLNWTNAQVSVTSSALTYSENFNSLPKTGAATSTNPNPANWYRFASTVNATNLTVGNGSNTAGGFYSAGLTDSTDRALGSLLSSNPKPFYFGVKFINNTGSAIVAAAVSYKCEQWRRGNNNNGLKDTLLFEYSTSADSVNQTNVWTNVASLVGSSINSGTTTGALDGNVNSANISGNISGLAIPDGATFWIRFNDFDVSPGADDLLAVDDFSITFTTGTVAACTEPANSVTNLVATATSTTAISGSFTATTADGYLVLLDSNATVPTITDATTYAVNTTVGSATVIYNGTGTSFSKGGLVPNTVYHVYVFPYNNVSCTGGPNYKTSAPANDTAKTLVDACPEPVAEPTNLQFTFVDNTNINGNFNKAVPAPSGGYVVVYSTSSNVAYPLDDSSYSVGDSINYTSFKSKVAYVGTDSNFTVSGLIAGTRYYFAVVPFSACSGFPNYNRTTPLRDDTTTTGTAPLVDCVQPSGVSNTSIINADSTTNSITVKWKNPTNADSVMVIAGLNSSIGFVTVRDSVYYAVGSTIPNSNGVVYYRGTDSTFTLTGLTASAVYKILVVAFNNRNCTNGPNYAGVANKTIKTADGTDCQQPSGVSNTSIIRLDSTSSSISIKWTNPTNADSIMVLAGPNQSIGFVTIRDSAFYAVGSTIAGTNATVYYRGTDSTIVITGLTANMVYKILLVPFKNANCTNGPNYASIATITVKTLLSTSVKINQKEAAFTLYPNPTNNGLLFVKFDKSLREEATLEVIDLLGRKLTSQNIANGSDLQTIDVSQYAKGTYLLNIVYKGTTNVSTFIVQ